MSTNRATLPADSCFGHPVIHRELDVDGFLRALAHPVRREILCCLDSKPEWTRNELARSLGTVEAIDNEFTTPQAEVALYHHHLPLLEQVNLIEADDEFITITRGGQFQPVRDMVDAGTSVLE